MSYINTYIKRSKKIASEFVKLANKNDPDFLPFFDSNFPEDASRADLMVLRGLVVQELEAKGKKAEAELFRSLVKIVVARWVPLEKLKKIGPMILGTLVTFFIGWFFCYYLISPKFCSWVAFFAAYCFVQGWEDSHLTVMAQQKDVDDFYKLWSPIQQRLASIEADVKIVKAKADDNQRAIEGNRLDIARVTAESAQAKADALVASAEASAANAISVKAQNKANSNASDIALVQQSVSDAVLKAEAELEAKVQAAEAKAETELDETKKKLDALRVELEEYKKYVEKTHSKKKGGGKGKGGGS